MRVATSGRKFIHTRRSRMNSALRTLSKLLELGARLEKVRLVLEHAPELFGRAGFVSSPEQLYRSPVMPQGEFRILLGRLVNVSQMHSREFSKKKNQQLEY